MSPNQRKAFRLLLAGAYIVKTITPWGRSKYTIYVGKNKPMIRLTVRGFNGIKENYGRQLLRLDKNNTYRLRRRNLYYINKSSWLFKEFQSHKTSS